MARAFVSKESDDRIAHSVRWSPGFTTNRTQRERRLGSGNVRSGQAEAMLEAGARSSSKTGPDRPRKRETSRARGKKRTSGR